jgi:hypothetical protein
VPSVSNKARDRRLIKRKVAGETLPEIAAQEGMTKNGVFLALKRLEPQLLTALKRADYGLDKAVMKMVELTDATKTESINVSYEESGLGKPQEIRESLEVADNSTRFKARESMLRLHRSFGDDKAAPTNPFGNGPVMVIVGASNDRIKRLRSGNIAVSMSIEADNSTETNYESANETGETKVLEQLPVCAESLQSIKNE